MPGPTRKGRPAIPRLVTAENATSGPIGDSLIRRPGMRGSLSSPTGRGWVRPPADRGAAGGRRAALARAGGPPRRAADSEGHPRWSEARSDPAGGRNLAGDRQDGRMAEHPRPLHFATRAVTGGRPPAVPDAPLNTAGRARLHLRLVRRARVRPLRATPPGPRSRTALGDLEGGTCVSFASGMAAVSAVLDLVPVGGTVVAPRHSYTGTVARLRELEERGAVRTVWVDLTDTAAVVEAARGAALVLARVADEPGARARRHPRDRPRRARGRRARRGRQHLRDPAAAAARSSTAPTSSCTP